MVIWIVHEGTMTEQEHLCLGFVIGWIPKGVYDKFNQ